MFINIWLFVLSVVGIGVCHTYSLAGAVYTCTNQEGRVIYTDSPAQLAPCHLFAFAGQEASRHSLLHSEPAPEHGNASVPWRPPVETEPEHGPTPDDADSVPPAFPPGFDDMLVEGTLPTEFSPEEYVPPDLSLE